jgi:predicted ATPase
MGSLKFASSDFREDFLFLVVVTGKTMLMDMFYSATEGVVKHRRRFHFHEVKKGKRLGKIVLGYRLCGHLTEMLFMVVHL